MPRKAKMKVKAEDLVSSYPIVDGYFVISF